MAERPQVLKRATEADRETLLALIAAFCAADGHRFDAARIECALGPLLTDDRFGRIYLLGEHQGYAVITWGYSLESGGREALIDEIYVHNRGLGLGSQAMQALIDTLSCEDVKVIFLETERPNRRARSFYSRFGFTEDDSVWMSRSLP